MNKPKVFIYPGDSYTSAIKMFEARGFEHVKDFEKVDLVCFLGGTDVDPLIYGEKPGPYTQSPNKVRDVLEVSAYHKWETLGIPMVGICRGGQLLNVLNGGKMIQHLGKTVSGDVDMYTYLPELVEFLKVRVDHHQGIKGSTDGICLADHEVDDETYADYVVFYPKTKSLCFQPHPEWGHKGTEEYFFNLIGDYLGLKGN